MRYWQDDYLQQLTESEPYRGLRESGDREFELACDKAKSIVDKIHTNGHFSVIMKDNYVCGIFIFNGYSQGYFPKSADNKRCELNKLSLNPKELKPAEKDPNINIYEIFNGNKTGNDFKNLITSLSSNGYELINKSKLSDGQWSVINKQLQQKYSKSWGSDVAASISSALSQSSTPAWQKSSAPGN